MFSNYERYFCHDKVFNDHFRVRNSDVERVDGILNSAGSFRAPVA